MKQEHGYRQPFPKYILSCLYQHHRIGIMWINDSSVRTLRSEGSEPLVLEHRRATLSR